MSHSETVVFDGASATLRCPGPQVGGGLSGRDPRQARGRGRVRREAELAAYSGHQALGPLNPGPRAGRDHSWAERPLISCQLDPGTGWEAAAPGCSWPRLRERLWWHREAAAAGLPGTHCEHMLTGRLPSEDHKRIPFSVCSASVTICVLWQRDQDTARPPSSAVRARGAGGRRGDRAPRASGDCATAAPDLPELRE